MSPTREALAARLRQAAPMVKPMAVRGVLPAWIAEVVLQAAEVLSHQGEAKPVAWVFTDHLERMKTWNGSTGEMRLWRYAPTLNKGYTPLYTAPPPSDALREREKIVAWLRDTPYVNIATYSASDFANAIERGEHMEAAALAAPEHVSASAPRKDAGAAASANEPKLETSAVERRCFLETIGYLGKDTMIAKALRDIDTLLAAAPAPPSQEDHNG